MAFGTCAELYNYHYSQPKNILIAPIDEWIFSFITETLQPSATAPDCTLYHILFIPFSSW